MSVSARRSIAFRGRDLTICGCKGDPYFEGARPDEPANEFLLKIAGHIQPDAVIADVGANIGITAAVFSAVAPQGKVYCFEPSPSAFGHLVETLCANRMDNSVAINAALGRQAGKLGFYDNPQSASASHLSDGGTLRPATHTVDVMTLDAFVRDNSVERMDFIKVDVEGFEMDVLAGAERVLRDMQPTVFVEFNAFTLMGFANLNPRSVIEQLVAMFPYVYRQRGGTPMQVKDRMTILEFLHDNITSRGCVDDLCCCYKPLLAA